MDDYLKYSEKTDEDGVEYFMDDEDHVWLEKMNKKREHDAVKAITHDQFEGIIDRLEKDSVFETNSKKRDLDDTEAVCCVCNDGEVMTSILFRF